MSLVLVVDSTIEFEDCYYCVGCWDACTAAAALGLRGGVAKLPAGQIMAWI